MKILIDGRWIKQTGIGRYIENTLTELLKLDKTNDYVLLIRTKDKAAIDIRADNLEFVETDIDWYGVKEQTELLGVLNAQKPDLVHFTNFNFPVGYKGKFVITIHDLTLLRFKNIRNSISSKLFYRVKDQLMRTVLSQGTKKAKAIIVPTEFVKEDVAKTYRVRRNKIVVTHEAVDKEFAKPRINLEKHNITKPFLLYVGNAYPHKNIERLILAFGKLITQYLLDYQLVIAGKKDSFHQNLEEVIKEVGLEDRVVFTGFVSDQELAGLYKNAKLYVFPSLSEGFGLPPLEAMAHKLPVASSDATCLPEILGDAAIYFNPKNIGNMAKVISNVLHDEKKQEELVKLGLRQVKKYSWRTTAKQTLEVYEKALRN